jgi:cytoskeletal protein CcmA (bactofilin family)
MPVGDLRKLPCGSLDGQEVRDMLFNRKPEKQAASGQLHAGAFDAVSAAIGQPAAAPTQTVIDASVAIMGDLRSEGDVQLDGHICGNVECAQLIVGKDAAITGAVAAEQIVVRGKITGTIRARTVILQETARVEGDIVYSLLALDEGARFEGSARRSPDPLHDDAAVSALADLQRMVANPQAGRAPCAADANGQANAGTVHPPRAPAAIQAANGAAGKERRPGDSANG